MADSERRGLISRFFSRPADSARDASGTGPPRPPGDEVWADNATRPVRGLVAAALREPRCLIVTGYQDFLSSLTLIPAGVSKNWTTTRRRIPSRSNTAISPAAARRRPRSSRRSTVPSDPPQRRSSMRAAV